MGHDLVDYGGFGVVGCAVGVDMIDEVIGKASVLTRAVANLDDTKLFKKYPDVFDNEK